MIIIADNSEDEDDISITSDQTLKVSSRSRKKEHKKISAMSSNSNNRNEVEHITVKELNTIINEFLVDKQIELGEINILY